MASTRLSPRLADWKKALINQPNQIRQILDKYGSPVNLLNKASFFENLKRYNEVFRELEVKGKVFYARKANKSISLLEDTDKQNYGIDTASYNEVKQSLNVGVKPENIVITAAVKTKQLIELALENNLLLIVDNEDELETIVEIAEGRRVILGFRISGFEVNDAKLYSRFGVDIDNALGLIQEWLEKYENIEYRGLHFHLDGYDLDQRRKALEDCLQLAESLPGTEFIDIGGGLLMNYLEDQQEWENFERRLVKSLGDGDEEITYKRDGLGFEIHEGKVRGRLKTYPYYNQRGSDEALRYILSGFEEKLRSLDIEIRLEPGRSMLNQVGMTVAKVVHRKVDSKGDHHIGLEMNMTQMASGSADFLLDPIVLYSDVQSNDEVEVYFTGAYCLERDVLLKRKIKLDRLPSKGDLVIFPNTAGYMMHFFESQAHQFPLARNIFVDQEVGQFVFYPDPIDQTEIR